jgi:hypothetical protein
MGGGGQLVTGAAAHAQMQALSGQRLPGPGGRVMPRGAAQGPAPAVGFTPSPYGVAPLANQVLAGPFPANSLAVPQTADLTFLDQPFLPTVRQYVPVGRGRAEGPDGGAGGRLLAPQPTIHPVFWNVTVWAKEIVRGPGEPAPTKEQLAGALGCSSSYYKIRLQWNLYPSREREVLLDAGTAFDVCVGPTNNLFVDLMAPDPDSSDPRPDAFNDFRVDVYVVASAWGASVPIGHPTGRFTQALYFPEASPPGPTRCIRIADGARTLQILNDVDAQPAISSWAIDDTDGSALPSLGNVDLNIEPPPNTRDSDIVTIPQNAKAICFEAEADTLFNVVQGLEL